MLVSAIYGRFATKIMFSENRHFEDSIWTNQTETIHRICLQKHLL